MIRGRLLLETSRQNREEDKGTWPNGNRTERNQGVCRDVDRLGETETTATATSPTRGQAPPRACFSLSLGLFSTANNFALGHLCSHACLLAPPLINRPQLPRSKNGNVTHKTWPAMFPQRNENENLRCYFRTWERKCSWNEEHDHVLYVNVPGTRNMTTFYVSGY